MEIAHVALVALVVLAAPLLGGLLFGVDRIVSARMQNRQGPLLAQPFYDLIKLFGKSRMAANSFQMVAVSLFLASMVLALILLITGQDLLVLLFIVALGNIMLILGGFSVRSPYSHVGSQREVLQMLAYEPLLVLMVVGVYMQTGSFMGSSVLALGSPLVLALPMFIITQTIVVAIKLHKSPFDTSGSHHAHQELVRGIYTEYSGSQLAIIELAHWYELPVLLGCIGFLCYSGAWAWWVNALVGPAAALACFFIVILIDNVTARMNWRWVLRFSWTWGLTLAVGNLLVLYALPLLTGQGGPR